MDIHSVLADHRSKNKKGDLPLKNSAGDDRPTTSEIPDIFFDNILTTYKLNRVETLVLMYLYRRVWCKPNLYKIFGISPMLSLSEMSKHLQVSIEDIYTALRNIEGYGFISTIRSGQYFVRKYFTREWDERFSQTYDDFEI